MTPTLSLDADRLARHRLRTHADTKSLRPRRFRLDSEGISLAVALPGPDYLAAFLDLDGLDIFRAGAGALLARPTGSEAEPEALTLADLRSALWQALAALPEIPDATEAYRDLRLAARTRSAMFGAYLDDVLRDYRLTRPALPKRPKAPQERPRVKAPAERKRAERDRRRAEEHASAAWVLATYLDDEEVRPVPGSRVSGSEVYAYAEEMLSAAVEAFEELVVRPDPVHDREVYLLTREERLAAWDEERDLFEPHPAPRRPRLVSRQVLFKVAAVVGFRVTRPQGSVALTIPQEVATVQHTAPMFTRAEILAEVARQKREAVSAEAEALVVGVEEFFAEAAHA